MLFWIFMLLFVLMIPLTMIYFGRRFFKSPPKSINATFGYRSTMSMKNQETWKLAHRVCGRYWFVCGLILLPLSVLPMLFVINRDRARHRDDRVHRGDHRVHPARPDALRAPGHGTRAAEKV